MTDTIVVRGVAAMPSRIARVVYVRREKDALEQFLTDKLAFYLLFISNRLGVEKILDGFAEVAASPPGQKAEAPGPSILETLHFSERCLHNPLNSPGVQRGGPDEVTIFNCIIHSSFRDLCRCRPLIFTF
jgi:hypothetical protein